MKRKRRGGEKKRKRKEMVVGDGWIKYVVVGIEDGYRVWMGTGELGIEEKILMTRTKYFF